MHCPLQFKFKNTIKQSQTQFLLFTTSSQISAQASYEHKQKCRHELKTLVSGWKDESEALLKHTTPVSLCSVTGVPFLCYALSSSNTNSTIRVLLVGLTWSCSTQCFMSHVLKSQQCSFLHCQSCPHSLGSYSTDWMHLGSKKQRSHI